MPFIPYLQLNVNAKKQFGFYEKVFQQENLGVITFGEIAYYPRFPFP